MGGPGSISARRLMVEIQRLEDMRRSSLRVAAIATGSTPLLHPRLRLGR
jgi:hypothetical protein